LAGIQALSPRDVFFDAPLTGKSVPLVESGDPYNNLGLNATFDITISPIASTDYQVAVGWSGIGSINETQLTAIQKLVAVNTSYAFFIFVHD
jgi:hypothetical protein